MSKRERRAYQVRAGKKAAPFERDGKTLRRYSRLLI
jgi:hypothetical protein